MNYLGKKSVSSVLSVVFKVSWYITIVLAVIAAVVGSILVLAPVNDPSIAAIAANVNLDLNHADFLELRSVPLAVRALFVPYFVILVLLILKIIKLAQQLFTNFTNELVFHHSNVETISKISKFIIILSIMTFDFGSLVLSLFLLILCAIFKNGTALQEEHDLTV